MAMQNEGRTSDKRTQTVTVTDRRVITLSGIDEVISFDDTSVVLSSAMGILTLDGSELNITRLSLDTGDVVIEGLLGGMFYSEANSSGKRGVFRRVFGS